jgi:hypothetical protein
MMMEGSGSGSVHVTNGSGCGSEKLKNIRIRIWLRIRIRNTAGNKFAEIHFLQLPVTLRYSFMLQTKDGKRERPKISLFFLLWGEIKAFVSLSINFRNHENIFAENSRVSQTSNTKSQNLCAGRKLNFYYHGISNNFPKTPTKISRNLFLSGIPTIPANASKQS